MRTIRVPTFLIIAVSCLVLFLSMYYGFALGMRRTRNAKKLFDNATLVTIPEASTPQGVSYQAIGILIPQNQNYLLKPLTNSQPITLQSSHPLFVSADRQNLRIGNQYVRIADWALVSQSERGWETLRDDFNTLMNGVPSRDNQYYFYIGTNNAFIPAGQGDWVVSVSKSHLQKQTLYIGYGRVQQAGWAPDQQSIYVANEGHILNISIK